MFAFRRTFVRPLNSMHSSRQTSGCSQNFFSLTRSDSEFRPSYGSLKAPAWSDFFACARDACDGRVQDLCCNALRSPPV